MDILVFLYLGLCVVFRDRSRTSRRINFEENSQTFTISSLTQKSMEDNGISLQVGHTMSLDGNVLSDICLFLSYHIHISHVTLL